MNPPRGERGYARSKINADREANGEKVEDSGREKGRDRSRDRGDRDRDRDRDRERHDRGRDSRRDYNRCGGGGVYQCEGCEGDGQVLG